MASPDRIGSIYLTNLPHKLISLICSYLSNRDIKSFRLIYSLIKKIAYVQLPYTFLFANFIYIRVFRAIAEYL